jgi:hypothetical protein
MHRSSVLQLVRTYVLTATAVALSACGGTSEEPTYAELERQAKAKETEALAFASDLTCDRDSEVDVPGSGVSPTTA